MKNIFTKDKDEVIIGLTSKDISVSYKKKPDRGVQGLGSVSTNACVVSTLRQSALQQPQIKTTIRCRQTLRLRYY